MNKTRKPPVVRAKAAGSCCVCAGRIYVGDRIRINPPNDAGVQTAQHADCLR